jgi:hypothetical protein
MPDAAEPQPRYDFDLAIVMGFQEVRAKSLPLGSPARVYAQEAWRRAYFEFMKLRRAMQPHTQQNAIHPYTNQDSSHAQ